MTLAIITAARELVARLLSDIPLAKTREEHIRVSARANEAQVMLTDMEALTEVLKLKF